MWQPRFIEGARMKYLGIVEALEADIHSGRLAPGERLPPQRAIAEALGVDLTTVTRAFNEARRRNLVAAQAGRGTFVREDTHTAGLPAPVLDLSMNIPPQPPTVDFGKLLPQGIASILAQPRGRLSLHYQESAGAQSDRRIAAEWLSARHGRIADERVIVTGGAQTALFALCDLFSHPDDRLATGAMTYPGLKAAAKQRGIGLAPVAMDEQGLIPEDFARLCAEQAPRALYIIPTIDNPTTATLPEGRRQDIITIARRHDVILIEDDPYAPLRTERQPSFLTLAPDITWHLATLSKSVTPALRVAYVVAPDAHQALRLAAVLRVTMLMAPPLLAALASRWITEGLLDKIAAAIRAENCLRQGLAARIFADHDVKADPEGHHLWLAMPPHWRANDFAEHADRAGVSIVPASAFRVGAQQTSENVRISLGVAPDRDVLEEGLTLLSALLQQSSLLSRAVV